MELAEQNILFFSRSTQHGGTENVILQLCEILHPLVNKIVVVTAEGFAVKKLKPFGIKHYTIPDIENKSPETLLKVCRSIKKIVKDEKITVIHTHHRMAAFYVRLLGLYKDCCFINTSHNTFTNHRRLTRYAYKYANLIACGEMVKKNLVEVFGLPNVTVIHNAVKPFTEDIVVDSVLANAKTAGKFLIGNVGRLSEQKGMEFFIQAIPIILYSHPEAEFYIIGSGEDEKKLKEMSKGYPVSFMGYRTDVQNVMSQLDVIVLSSLWEGLPLTPIEAFSVGKTIVATDVDGTVEIVQNGHNGLIAKPKDPKSLAENIIWMIENADQKKEMEKNAKESYKMHFSFEAFSKAYEEYYRSL